MKIFREKTFWLYFLIFFFTINALTIISYKIFMSFKPYSFTLNNSISTTLILKKQIYHISNIGKANWTLIFICCIRNFLAILAFYSLVSGTQYVIKSHKFTEKYKIIKNVIYGFLIFFVLLGFKRGKAMTKIFFLTSNDSLLDNFNILFSTIIWHEMLEYSALIIASYITIVKILTQIKCMDNGQETTENNKSLLNLCDDINENFKWVAILCFILLFIASYIEIQLTPFTKFYDSTPPFFN